MKKKLMVLLVLVSSMTNVFSQSAGQYLNGAGLPFWVPVDCSAFGSYIINCNGNFNTAAGNDCLVSITNGENNTGIGNESLYWNFGGNRNTAGGYRALYLNCNVGQGDDNTAIGYRTLYSNQLGDGNTGIGEGVLNQNIGGSGNTGSGAQALFNSAGGASNPANNNTSIGYLSMYDNTTGDLGSAAGYAAMNDNTTGDGNTAVGSQAFAYNTNGNSTGNTSMGYQANAGNGYNNPKTRNRNTSTGSNSMQQAFECNDNVAFGFSSLQGSIFRMGGNRNLAIGRNASNSLSGLSNPFGSDNVAVGLNALLADTYGEKNVVVGTESFKNSIATSENVGIGPYVGNTNAGYLKCSFAGYQADANTGSTPLGSTSFGYNSLATSNLEVRIGDVNVLVIEGTPALYTGSDGRFKYNIREGDVKGLDFVLALRPVTYNFNVKKIEETITTGMPEDIRKERLSRPFNAVNEKKYCGFLAQEVESAMTKTAYDFSGLYKPQSQNDIYGLRYGTFVVPLVKAVQEQQKLIEAAENHYTSLEQVFVEREQILQSQKEVPCVYKIGMQILIELNQQGSINGHCTKIPFINDSTKELLVAIHSLSGKQISLNRVNSQSNTVMLNTAGLEPGIYLCSVIADGQVLNSQTMVLSD